MWVQSKPDGSLWRIAPDGRVLARIPGVSSNPGFHSGQIGPLQTLASGFGSIWTLGRHAVVRIDPATNQPVTRIQVPYGVSLVAGMGAVWVACGYGAIRLLRIDPSSNANTPVKGPRASAAGIAVGGGKVWWINSSEAASVSAIDPETGTQRYIQTPFYVSFVVPTPTNVWLIGSAGDVARIPAGAFKPVGRIQETTQVIGVDLSGETIWMNTGDLVGFDARTGKVIVDAPVAGPPPPQALAGVARLGGRVWVVDIEGRRVVGVNVRPARGRCGQW